ncbi:hypothetical protein S7711_01013 [Stachybotrys chartarum IBT 7711]|uniref:Uncharacterized protein n=1 Tax=Stachybotrys chartarum (strain CBS 109288 / IBT 7711) TaxID=1280523 RepID=A0A084B452_STACB|nr:hypothetical protein S7711_01013 [Stachybotrys chartarum IBT 7711]
MSDGIAPAIDKVGAPAPKAPEAEAGAPSVSLGEAPPASTSAAPAAEPEDNNGAIPDGAGPALAAPKPVEVKSVPETPLDSNTPAGGTPRPELNLSGGETSSEPTVTTGVLGPQPTATTSAPENGTAEQKPSATSAANGASAPTNATDSLPAESSGSSSGGPAVNEKRKLDEAADATNGAMLASVEDVDEPVDKKIKTNGGTSPKSAKTKKDNSSPSAGKTARKTRSQGPVEV